MLKLYLVRHGETEWNREKRYLGHANMDLNGQGKVEAEKLRSALGQVEFRACYASDLVRTQKTAEIIVDKKTLVQGEPALRELNFGNWEGLTYGEITKRYPEELELWVDSQGRTSSFGGEDLGDLEVRVSMWLNTLLSTRPTGDVLIVSHGGPLRVLLCLLLGISTGKHWQFTIETGGLAVVEIHDGQGILQALYKP